MGIGEEMNPRKGTKSNPFELGDRVKLTRSVGAGEVVEVRYQESGFLAHRRFAPIEYKVWFDGQDAADEEWYRVMDLVLEED